MTSKTKKLVRVKKETTTPRRRLRLDFDRIAASLNQWKRPLRITIATLISVLWVGLAIAVLNLVLPADSFADPDSAFNIVLGLSILGVVLYGLGWGLLVGFDLDPSRVWQAGRASVYYLLSGVVVVMVIVIGLIFGILYAFVI